jgi:hypothetical protein
MDKLESIIAYLCCNYPHQQELSKARLTKLVYLADWFFSLVKQKQMTHISWIFNHFGPYVDDVINAVLNNPMLFNIQHTNTRFGTDKLLISCTGSCDNINLHNDEIEILNFVINKTKDMYFDKFIDYIYSTYPIAAEQRYATLDLVSLAQEYKAKQSSQ